MPDYRLRLYSRLGPRDPCEIRYRNSFLPRMSGSLVAAAAGTKTHVLVSLHRWRPSSSPSCLTVADVAAFDAVGATEQPRGVLCFVPLALPAFGVAPTLAGFIPEAIKAMKKPAALSDTGPSHVRTPTVGR